MRISFPTLPIDIIFCMVWSFILIPIALIDIEGSIRVIIGLPFIIFIPGYILIFTLFPEKTTNRGIDTIERIALSFGLSLAIVPLIGLGLNYTTLGIRLESILLSLFIYVMILGLVGIFRWKLIPSSKRFKINIDIPFPKHQNRIDKILFIILAISILISISLLMYIAITPRTGEQFTEFYLLGSSGIADDYPHNLSMGQEAEVIIGLVNHEKQIKNYTIEIWLINQSLKFNTIRNQNETIYHEMWYMDSIQTTLDHVPIDIKETWKPQWEKNYSFSIFRNGTYKLVFLLYIDPSTQQYQQNVNYHGIASDKIENSYRDLHLWLTISPNI